MMAQQRSRDVAKRNGKQNGHTSLLDELPLDRLKDELADALGIVADKATDAASDKISGLTDRLVDISKNGGVLSKAVTEGGKEAVTGGSPVKGAVKGGLSGMVDKAKDKAKDMISGGGSSGGKGAKKATKSTNIVESIDIGAPVRVVYNQWTQFQEFSGFMKKVEKVEQQEDEKVEFKAQVLWSHRTWQSTILEQVPDDRIVWRSQGEKGHVDGAVTFHELAPNLTRVLVVLEYYPQGLFERTGNIWRAQGRRARLELKHFRRHVMVNQLLHEDEVEGWRGEISDGEVTRTHEEAMEAESEESPDDESEDAGTGEEAEDEYEDQGAEDEGEPEDEYEYEDEPGEEPQDEYEDEGEPEDEYEDEPEPDEEPEDEYEDEPEPDEEPEDQYEDEPGEEPQDEYEDEPEPEDEYDEDEYKDEKPARRRRAS